jgi:hypothetical protein
MRSYYRKPSRWSPSPLRPKQLPLVPWDYDGQRADDYGIDGYPSMTYIGAVLTFVETKLFTSLIPQYPTDDEYSTLQQELATRPDAGQVIPGAGGVRKLR